jgi:hypothetical protein
LSDCVYHPGTRSVAQCQRCYRELCRSCVVEIPYQRYYCRSCAAVQQKPSGLAVASLVVSIAGAAIFGVIAVVGMIMGIVENRRIRRGESPEAGLGLTKAAIVIGALAFAFGLAGVFYYIILPLLLIPV